MDVIIFHFETKFNIILIYHFLDIGWVEASPSMTKYISIPVYKYKDISIYQVGGSKPQYDIWGNTVNVASRYFNLFFSMFEIDL